MVNAAEQACPCASQQRYEQCCKPFHDNQPAPIPERLMRSRYSAYVLGLIDYLVATTLPAQQAHLDRQAMARWSRESRWLGLTVEQADPPEGDRGQVVFVARWLDPDASEHSHRECSDFVRKNGRWFFVDPNHSLRAGRNEPCPCGSGRKFKQCCML